MQLYRRLKKTTAHLKIAPLRCKKIFLQSASFYPDSHFLYLKSVDGKFYNLLITTFLNVVVSFYKCRLFLLSHPLEDFPEEESAHDD